MAAPTRSISGSASNSMPPPPSPSPSASGSSVLGKRRRTPRYGSSADLKEVMGLQRASSSFSESTKDQIEAANGGEDCWSCNAPVVHYCHIIPQGNRRMFRELRRRGLLDIDTLHTPANGIALCPTCHALFDAHEFPGWVFFPTDLQYFLDFEDRDFERRQKHHDDTGEWPVRAVPSAENYLQFQSNIVPQTVIGGLYRRIYFHSRLSTNGVAVFGESAEIPPKPWHGCPLAALNRAFNSLGSQSHIYSSEVRQQLRDLQDLYGIHDYVAGVILAAQTSSGPAAAVIATSASPSWPQALYGTPNTLTNAQPKPQTSPAQNTGQSRGMEQPQNVTRKRKRAWSDGSSRSSQYEPLDAYPKRRASDKHIPWVWGPNSPAEEKIKFYRGIYSIGKTPSIGDGGQEETETTTSKKTPKASAIAGLAGHEMKKEVQGTVTVLPSPQASAK